jgi:hypothetical protein
MPSLRSRLLPVLVSASLTLLAGCSLGRASSTQLVSANTGDSLSPALPIRLYTARDKSSADFYLTDLPESTWGLEEDLRDTSGVIIHVTMFIEPKSGKTPIATSAVSGTVRYLVLSNGEVGVYGGGGFVQISGDPGDKTLDASIRDASLRLVRATPGFRDRIGNGRFSLSTTAEQSPEKLEQLAAMLDALQNETSIVK